MELTQAEKRRIGRYEVAQNGCWIWRGTVATNGYGRVMFRGRMMAAHRLFFVLHRGPIPEGLELDHLCSTRPCVNPAHLEPVTHMENIRRAHVRKPELASPLIAGRDERRRVGRAAEARRARRRCGSRA